MIETGFDQQQKLATFNVKGDIGLQEMLDLLETMHDRPEFDGSYRVLCDYSECNWTPMLEEFRSLEHAVVELLNKRQPKGVVAFVLGTETERLLMAQIGIEYDWRNTWSTFTELEEASNWLMSQPV